MCCLVLELNISYDALFCLCLIVVLQLDICLIAIWAVDSGVPKEAKVQSYSPGGTNVPSLWTHWRHLANTIEPSVCGGDAVLCQITLTTCYSYY